jgi:hypothetical protein
MLETGSKAAARKRNQNITNDQGGDLRMRTGTTAISPPSAVSTVNSATTAAAPAIQMAATTPLSAVERPENSNETCTCGCCFKPLYVCSLCTERITCKRLSTKKSSYSRRCRREHASHLVAAKTKTDYVPPAASTVLIQKLLFVTTRPCFRSASIYRINRPFHFYNRYWTLLSYLEY